MTIKEQVKDILLKENKNITLNTEADYDAVFKDIGADSLDLMMAMLKIGEVFALEIEEESLEDISSVNDLISFIEKEAK